MIANFDEAREVLRQFYSKSTVYDLNNMRRLVECIGNPQDTLKVVHVAGTSGKTSTAYYAATLLKAAGFKVGLTVSPHVYEVNERVQINLEPLPERQFCQALSEFLELIAGYDVKPSYFELMVGLAYWYFAKQKVDYAVVEVGLGGLLDTTNVITRADKVCIITDIGFDHTRLLGDTLSKIAAQKAGIIQPHNHVFVYEQGSEVMPVIVDVARKQQAMLHILNPQAWAEAHDLPAFQQRNYGLAKAAVQHVLSRDGVAVLNSKRLADAAHIYIPGRMETLYENGKTIIMDGAHNAQKLTALLDAIEAKYPGKPVAALVGFLESEPDRLERALQALMPRVTTLIATSFASDKDLPKHSVLATQITSWGRAHGYTGVKTRENPLKALDVLRQQNESVLLVTGSFYLFNHIRMPRGSTRRS